MTPKTKATPGPWSINITDEKTAALLKAFDQEGAEGDIEIWSGPDIIAIVRKPVDARLIASAPELLEAAKKVQQHGAWAHMIGNKELEKDIHALRAAIANAEGR